jgi:hypothetical protein
MLAHECVGEFNKTAFVRYGKEGEFGHAPRFLFARENRSKRETGGS